jgi:hypothetical protein
VKSGNQSHCFRANNDATPHKIARALYRHIGDHVAVIANVLWGSGGIQPSLNIVIRRKRMVIEHADELPSAGIVIFQLNANGASIGMRRTIGPLDATNTVMIIGLREERVCL